MRCRSEYARLCCLINRTLSPFTTEQLRQLCSLTKEKEKNLLIILSQISREIQRWDDEVGVVECSGDYHHCLPSIVSLLVLFLNVESRYVRHATTNVLVVISNFLVTSGGEWDGFLHLLFACFEVSMSNILASASVITPSAESDGDSSSYILCMRKQMVNANWCTLAGLVRALRTILKHLKKCPDGELAKVYMSFVDCLTNVPGELLNVMYVAQINDSQMSSCKDVFLHGDVSSSASLFVLLGSLLQLLCSLIHESSSTEVGTFDEHPIFGKLTNLVPKLLHWCFHEPKESNWTCSFRYLRHKMLDDFLFEILLHLSSLPFSFGQMDYKGRTKVFNELKGDILCHLSNVLNPVCLFHIFLAEVNLFLPNKRFLY
ncbi:hypothetical protein IFM89_032051 [Coptis chinensis]|uniref:Uncharacterized protein n=1 Tax=Coptis chinensis TaxID=261450 RepID=A0A835I7Z5_9MAGN|nr:hypothetical protein IFM89_032051 [Coptis chinensis]